MLHAVVEHGPFFRSVTGMSDFVKRRDRSDNARSLKAA